MEVIPSNDMMFELWWLFRRTSHITAKVREKELQKYGISLAESAVLFTVNFAEGYITPAGISRQLHRDPHSVSELLKRMEKRGLLRRIKDLDKKNQIRVELTEKGKEAYYQSTKRESLRKLFSVLSWEQWQQLESCFNILRDKALIELGQEPNK